MGKQIGYRKKEEADESRKHELNAHDMVDTFYIPLSPELGVQNISARNGTEDHHAENQVKLVHKVHRRQR